MAELGETMRAKASLLAIVGLTGSALVAGGGVQACAQGSGNTEQDISPTDESGELGGGGQSGQPTTGGSTGGLVVDGGVGDGALDDASACAADTFPGVLVPLELYIKLDRSSTMDDGCPPAGVPPPVVRAVVVASGLATGPTIGPPLAPPPAARSLAGAAAMAVGFGPANASSGVPVPMRRAILRATAADGSTSGWPPPLAISPGAPSLALARVMAAGAGCSAVSL